MRQPGALGSPRVRQPLSKAALVLQFRVAWHLSGEMPLLHSSKDSFGVIAPNQGNAVFSGNQKCTPEIGGRLTYREKSLPSLNFHPRSVPGKVGRWQYSIGGKQPTLVN